MAERFGTLSLLLVLSFSLSPPASAQSTGLELALHGSTQVAYGDALRMSGVVYEVVGYADLRPVANGEVVARLRDYDQRARRWSIVQEVTVRTNNRGEMTFELPVPERRYARPQLQIEMRKGQARRELEWGVQLRSPLSLDLLLDRNRYEPGEKVHVWTRLVRASDGAPVSGRSVRVRVTDPSGRPLAERSMPVGASGAVSLDVELPDSAPDGSYLVRVDVDDSIAAASTQRRFSVARRTVERLLVEATLDQQVVPPSGQLTGRVSVTTPSGNPVVGAEVQLQVGNDRRQRQVLQTDDEGLAAIRMQAPAYLSGDVQAQSLQVRVSHPAHGTLHAAASFLLSRVQWRVQATAENGGIVPEVDADALVAVTDPRGEPAPAGTKIRVTGATVRGREVELEIDRHGLAVVPLRVPDGQAGPMRASGSGCAGRTGVSIDVEVLGDRPAFARACIPVATKARVRPRVVDRVVAPGGVVEVALARHPEVRGRPVLVEVIAAGRAVVASFASGDRARLELPSGVAGVLQVRARPAMRHDGRHALDVPGGSSLGTGAIDAFLVRPADAFGLEIRSDQDRYRVRETAQLALDTTSASPQAWAALVARDLAAHGGEGPWALDWMHGAIADAARRPDTEGAELLLRAALVAGLSPDGEPSREPPLVQPYWRSRRGSGGQVGTLRDPVAARDRMRRRQVGQLMVALERIIGSLGADPARREGVVVRRGNGFDFDPNVIANLVRERRLSESMADTLGGETSSLAMIRAIDPSFSFDKAARRIARARLVELMVAIARFSNPDDANAARASQGQPPERWLSRMVQLGVLRPAQLLDPWGRPFEFRRATRPGIVISDRAPTWELASAGPDGRFGSADDIRNPFQRIVAEGTPYAVASGEDNLMKALSTLAPGPRVLMGMAQAYASMSLQAREEQRQRAVTATTSEQSVALDGLLGGAMGGGGMAAGRRSVSRARPSASPAPPAEAAGEAMAMEEAEADDAFRDADEDGRRERSARNRQQGPRQDAANTFAQLSNIVRERFPATLHFVGEVPLDGTSTTVPLPLADALTTYRVEAIAWTGSGWVTTSKIELRVDQDATVDAPIPPFGTVGDVLRIPVRVANRTGQPIEAKIVIEAEGLTLPIPAPVTVTVPPRDAVEQIVEVRPTEPGEGAVLVRALRASDDQPYDAVRRPLTLWPDARLVRTQRELLVEPDANGEASITIDVPDDATPRGPGEIRVVPATALFGEMRDEAHPLAGWVLSLLDQGMPEALLQNARTVLRAGDPVEEHDVHGAPAVLAMAISATWKDATVQDPVLRRGLRGVSRILGDPSVDPNPGRTLQLADVLAGLAPALRADGRAAVRGPLNELVSELRRRVGSGAVAASDAPIVWARSAAALAITGGEARARELLRRAERHVVRLDREAFLEPESQAGVTAARIEPTAIMAGAWASLGEPGRGLPFLRHLIALHRGSSAWPLRARVMATAAAGLIAGRGARGDLQAQVDGSALALAPVDESPQSPIRVAVLEGLGRPGTHRIRVTGAPMALVFVDVRYGRPWSAEPERSARLDLSIEGPIGPRDARAGLALDVRNRSPRLATAPVIEIDLPAGTELDEPTRAALRGVTISEPTVEGRTLQLRLRPMAPGGYARVPLPLRWSVGGQVRGLGVSAYDDATPPTVDVRPVSVLPSREIAIGDRGDEPEQAEAESSPVPEPPPPPPPLPRPVDQFQPVAFVVSSSVEVMS